MIRDLDSARFDEKEAKILKSMLKRVSDNIKTNGNGHATDY